MSYIRLGNITTFLLSAQEFRHLASTVFELMRVMHADSLNSDAIIPSSH